MLPCRRQKINMLDHSHSNQPLLVKEECSKVAIKELNVPAMKQAINNEGFLEPVSTDSTAFDEDSTSTVELIFNRSSAIGSTNVEICATPETSVDKFPCMSAKSAILLSQEETHDYHPNSPMLESCNRKQQKTNKLYRFVFSFLDANQATSPSGRRFSQVNDSTTATKCTSPSKNKKASTKINFSPLFDGGRGSTSGGNPRRRLITTVSPLFCFARRD